jgi:hypothetical protein
LYHEAQVTKTLQINIQTSADLKGVQAAQKALADLAKASGKPSGGGAAGAANAFNAQAKAANTAAQAAAKLAIADSRVAAAASNAATAVQRNAAAASNAAAAHTRAEKAALSYATAQARAAQATTSANSGMAVLPRTIAGLSHEAAAFATASLTMGAAVGVAAAAVQSFADAFQFKAQLDATTLAVNAQLKGMRDSGQVWNEAAAFATKFKLTQQETTQAISASIGVMRASKAPVEDILGVLARMQVLSPEQSLEEAAIALKALASGDTTSLVTRFEVGRDVANQMKAEIQGGADAVAVMGKFLEGTGIGMDVLAAKTTGAAGKIKDLAIAQEQLKLAQADFAQGPGMAILDAQIKVTSDATKALGGDFQSLNAIINDSGMGALNPIIGALASYNDMVFTAGKGALEWAASLDASSAAGQASAAGLAAFDAELAKTGDTALAEAAYQATYAAEIAKSTAVTIAAVPAFGAYQQAAIAATQGQMQLAAAAAASAMQSQTDALAKAEQASKTELAAAQANAAVSAFMLLHPNITASGVASIAAANNITPLLSQLIQATLRAREAAAALAAFNAAQGVKAKVSAGANFAERHGGIDSGELTPGSRARAAKEIALQQSINAAKKASDLKAARDAQTLAVGTAAQKQAILKSEYDTAVKQHGAQSVEAVNAQTKMLQAVEKGGAAGGAARAKAAGAAATKLEGIETKTGDKLAQIVQDTQAKLIAIDRAAAAERAKIAADLANKIATSAADRRATNEADDLDLIGVDDQKAAQKLNDRERAQAKARESEVAAAKEAQDAIANGEVESASKVYDIREKQISDQQALDEKYAERQQELAGSDENLAALKTQYDEATRATEEAAQRKIDIAKAEAAAKAGEVQAEKDAVIAAANEQANEVVNAAMRSAEGVKKATGEAAAKARADLTSIGDAVNAIPANKTITITVNQQGTVGTSSTGTPKAAGGGTFVTSGPTKLTVGDNPGGRELVTVTPLSGTGTTRMGGGLIAMAGGGVLDAGGGYTTPIAGDTGKKGGKGSSKGGGKAAAADAKKALDEMKNTISLLMDMAKLKEQIADLAGVPAFDIPVVQALVNRAQEFTAYVASHLVPITKAEGESLGRYLDAAKDAASMISDMASLKKDIAELKNVPAFDKAMVFALIDRAQEFTAAMQARLIPLTEFERDQMARYASVIGDVVGILKDMADLKKELAAPAPPIDTRYIQQLVADASAVTIVMREKIVPTTEAQADAMGQYASAASDTIAILNDVLDLGKNLKEGVSAPIPDALIIRLADQAARVATLVQARLLPTSEEQGAALSAYADVVGSSVSVLKDVSDLSGKLFTDYVSPTDAQINLLATDAQRVTAGIMAAASNYSTEGLAAGKAYAEGIGATFSAFKDGLLFFDALKSGDFKLDTGALATFETSTMATMETARRLGAIASTIPAGDMAALQTTTAALAAQSEALIRLAAVPFEDIAGAAAGLAQNSGALLGGGAPTNIYNTFNLPPGTPQQLATEVIRILDSRIGSRR